MTPSHLVDSAQGPGGRRRSAGLSNTSIAWLAYGGLTLLSAATVGFIIAAPWLRAHGHDDAAWVAYQSFHGVCHQASARSFSLWGYPLAVCSRCSALVFGGLLGLLLVPVFRSLRHPVPHRRWLAIAIAACAADVCLDWLGLPNTFVSRSATGGLLGATMAFYLVPAIVQAALSLAGRAVSPTGTSSPSC